MTDAPPLPIVDTPDALGQLVETLDNARTIALDTEFHAERRYRPQLMLLQVSADGGPVHTVDPLALDLQPLGPVLDGRTWLAHGAARDVELIHAATGARPTALLDTQVLAGLAGLHFPARLDALASEVLGVQVDKGATLSDWHRRPLNPEQLAYARTDVRLLCPLADALLARIDTLDAAIPGRQGRTWATMAGDELVADALADPDPHIQWRSLDIAPRFDGPTRQVLHALYTWRESEAQRKNNPPHFILAPSIALDLARRRPTDSAGLRANRRIPSGLLKRHANTLLAIISAAPDGPIPPPIPDSRRGGLGALLTAWSGCKAAELGIAAALLAPPHTIRAMTIGGSKDLSGWRSQALAHGLDQILSGSRVLAVDENGAVVTRLAVPSPTGFPAP